MTGLELLKEQFNGRIAFREGVRVEQQFPPSAATG